MAIAIGLFQPQAVAVQVPAHDGVIAVPRAPTPVATQIEPVDSVPAKERKLRRRKKPRAPAPTPLETPKSPFTDQLAHIGSKLRQLRAAPTNNELRFEVTEDINKLADKITNTDTNTSVRGCIAVAKQISDPALAITKIDKCFWKLYEALK